MDVSTVETSVEPTGFDDVTSSFAVLKCSVVESDVVLLDVAVVSLPVLNITDLVGATVVAVLLTSSRHTFSPWRQQLLSTGGELS